jgi:hypothetical protein
MKTLCGIRGGQIHPMIKKNDSFDSKLSVWEFNQMIYDIPYFNTDFFNGYKGGILSEGDYAFICGNRSNSGQKVLFLFDQSYFDKVNVREDVTEQMRILPSLIQNPNHNGEKIISQVLIHCDGSEGGWSNGCQTIYPDYWNNFIDLFHINEKGIYSLRRQSGWIAPDYFQGN